VGRSTVFASESTPPPTVRTHTPPVSWSGFGPPGALTNAVVLVKKAVLTVFVIEMRGLVVGVRVLIPPEGLDTAGADAAGSEVEGVVTLSDGTGRTPENDSQHGTDKKRCSIDSSADCRHGQHTPTNAPSRSAKIAIAYPTYFWNLAHTPP
jgi:hypothetical protein